MINLIFIVNQISEGEIEMGMRYRFQRVNDTIQYEAISATSNPDGFTPLTAIAESHRWDARLITNASDECNRRKETCIINTVQPPLLLVPRTRGITNSHTLIKDLLNGCLAIGVKTLRFTHYSFIQNRLPENEVLIILNHFFDTNAALKTIYWDIDARCIDQMSALYLQVYGTPMSIANC